MFTRVFIPASFLMPREKESKLPIFFTGLFSRLVFAAREKEEQTPYVPKKHVLLSRDDYPVALCLLGECHELPGRDQVESQVLEVILPLAN